MAKFIFPAESEFFFEIRSSRRKSVRSARFAANPILDFRNQKSGQSVKLFWILVSRKQQTGYSCRKIQAVETENK